MTYVFFCEKCGKYDEVVRSVDECSNPFRCNSCADFMQRVYTPPQLITKGEAIAYYHPAFGQVVKSDDHARRLAKERGWIEIGNEDVHKHTPPPKRVDYDCSDYFLDNGSISLNG